jgi:hypothetical protein
VEAGYVASEEEVADDDDVVYEATPYDEVCLGETQISGHTIQEYKCGGMV